MTAAQRIELLQQLQTFQQQITAVQAMDVPDSAKQGVIQELRQQLGAIEAQLNA